MSSVWSFLRTSVQETPKGVWFLPQTPRNVGKLRLCLPVGRELGGYTDILELWGGPCYQYGLCLRWVIILNCWSWINVDVCRFILVNHFVFSSCSSTFWSVLLIIQFFSHLKMDHVRQIVLSPLQGLGSRDEGTPTTNICINSKVIQFVKKRSCLNENGNQFWPLSKEALMSKPSPTRQHTLMGKESWSEYWWCETKTFSRAHTCSLCLQKRRNHTQKTKGHLPLTPPLSFSTHWHVFFFPPPLTHYPLPSGLCHNFWGQIALSQNLPPPSNCLTQ